MEWVPAATAAPRLKRGDFRNLESRQGKCRSSVPSPARGSLGPTVVLRATPRGRGSCLPSAPLYHQLSAPKCYNRPEGLPPRSLCVYFPFRCPFPAERALSRAGAVRCIARASGPGGKPAWGGLLSGMGCVRPKPPGREILVAQSRRP